MGMFKIAQALVIYELTCIDSALNPLVTTVRKMRIG